MPEKFATANVQVTLTGSEWSAICVRLVLGESLTAKSAKTFDVAKLKIMRQVLDAAKAFGPQLSNRLAESKASAQVIDLVEGRNPSAFA